MKQHITKYKQLYDLWYCYDLRHSSEGKNFTIRRHHDYLRLIMNLSTATGRLNRWRLLLMEYDLEVLHRPGSHNQDPDATIFWKPWVRTLLPLLMTHIL